MRHLKITIFFLLAGLAGASGQTVTAAASADAEAKAATEQLTAKYALTPDQAKAMYVIQARKLRNRAEIASLKTGNPALYRRKEQNVQAGTLQSIRHLLTTKDQLKTFDKTQHDTRSAKALKRKELTAGGASKEAIDDAMLAIYAE